MLNTYSITPQIQLLLNPLPEGSTIINLSSVSTVYVSSDRVVNPATAVPLAPLASYKWQKNSPAYAILDTAAPANASIIVTDEIDSYDNPIALASAVATQLASVGVPNVLLETTVAANQVIAPNSLVTFNISSFASIVISGNTVGGHTNVNAIQSMIQASLYSDYEQLNFDATTRVYRWSVSGDTLTINNIGTVAASITIVGSNRTYPNRFDARFNTSNICVYSLPNANYAANSTTKYNLQNLVGLQGKVYANFYMGTQACLIGMTDTQGQGMVVADSAEAYTSIGGGKYVAKLLAIPPGFQGFTLYMGGTAQTFAPVINLIAAEL